MTRERAVPGARDVPGHGARARWRPRRMRSHAVDAADWRGAGVPRGLVAR
jgi:hypothetical protein